jgi:DNA-binding NtrC family response regulator
MSKVLISWVGRTDLQAAKGKPEAGDGPVGQAIKTIEFDEINLLCNYAKTESDKYLNWARKRTKAKIVSHQIKLTGPTNFGEIYEAAVKVITEVLKRLGSENAELTFHLSPGTPAMSAVFVLLSKTRFPAELIQTSREKGLERASVPFEIGAEYIPDLLRRPDEEMQRLSAGLSLEAPEFDQIIRTDNSPMNKVIALARRAAPHRVSVLIEGESGTGKELIARAIHNASPCRNKPFIPVNCGAIPKDLVQSELFGHKKGAFTGATEKKEGHFLEASGGTLFLDEIGELPLDAQVSLLRALQEGEITRVGESKPVKVNVRVIAATNRNLITEMSAGRFREDLYFRLAVMMISVPPLRERKEDIGQLIDGLIKQLYDDSSIELGTELKNLSSDARSMLLKHTWPGNVRELRNTLLRAIIWSPSKTITVDDMRSAMAQKTVTKETNILNRPLGDGFNLQRLLADVTTHYLERAVQEAHGSKSKAARLVGAPNYQTLTNWLNKHGVEINKE